MAVASKRDSHYFRSRLGAGAAVQGSWTRWRRAGAAAQDLRIRAPTTASQLGY